MAQKIARPKSQTSQGILDYDFVYNWHWKRGNVENSRQSKGRNTRTKPTNIGKISLFMNPCNKRKLQKFRTKTLRNESTFSFLAVLLCVQDELATAVIWRRAADVLCYDNNPRGTIPSCHLFPVRFCCDFRRPLIAFPFLQALLTPVSLCLRDLAA